jgi:putative hydrolase of the HAD superfamily
MLVMVDLDNTLLDRHAAVAAWIDEFVLERALPSGAAEWIMTQDRDGYADRRSVFGMIRDKFKLGSSAESLLADYRQRVVELSSLTPGAAQCLELLRTAGCAIAIVSNGSSGQQHGKIEALGLRSRVDAVIVSGDLGIAKPDARVFQAAATSTDTTLEGSWMVGDSPTHDIVGASQCGVRTVWLHRGRHWTETTIEPTITISSLEELVPAVLGVDG